MNKGAESLVDNGSLTVFHEEVSGDMCELLAFSLKIVLHHGSTKYFLVMWRKKEDRIRALVLEMERRENKRETCFIVWYRQFH